MKHSIQFHNHCHKKRDRRKRLKLAIRWLEKVEIKINDDAPKTLEELFALYRSDGVPGRSIFTFGRHRLTNYDEICANLYHRFRFSMIEDLSTILYPRVNEALKAYFTELGYFNRPQCSKAVRPIASTIKAHQLRKQHATG